MHMEHFENGNITYFLVILLTLSLQCSSSCGGGKRTRDVKCYTDSEEDKTEKACDPKTKPPTEDFCNVVDCFPGK